VCPGSADAGGDGASTSRSTNGIIVNIPTKFRNAMLLFGLWINAYGLGLERSEGLTWKVWLLCASSAAYLIALLYAWDRKTEAYK
jgi:hypothetical protein